MPHDIKQQLIDLLMITKFHPVLKLVFVVYISGEGARFMHNVLLTC